MPTIIIREIPVENFAVLTLPLPMNAMKNIQR